VIRFVRAHGYDAGPTQRPLSAGALAGALATIPAGVALVGFGSFEVAADDVMRIPRIWTAVLVIGGFVLAGLLYGAFFQRAANDRRAGWLLGISYGFVLWVAAPMVTLPLIGGSAMAAGLAATGFLVTFLLWGLAAGALFPFVHRPLRARLEDDARKTAKPFGPDAVTLKQRLLRRPA
jgi:peptidoglycan/LPS O-acetylase OafA/YrhL